MFSVEFMTLPGNWTICISMISTVIDGQHLNKILLVRFHVTIKISNNNQNQRMRRRVAKRKLDLSLDLANLLTQTLLFIVFQSPITKTQQIEGKVQAKCSNSRERRYFI